MPFQVSSLRNLMSPSTLNPKPRTLPRGHGACAPNEWPTMTTGCPADSHKRSGGAEARRGEAGLLKVQGLRLKDLKAKAFEISDVFFLLHIWGPHRRDHFEISDLGFGVKPKLHDDHSASSA